MLFIHLSSQLIFQCLHVVLMEYACLLASTNDVLWMIDINIKIFVYER